MGKAILEELSKISADIKHLRNEVSDLRTTKELETEALMEWKPQLSNEVKAIHEKLDAAEKR